MWTCPALQEKERCWDSISPLTGARLAGIDVSPDSSTHLATRSLSFLQGLYPSAGGLVQELQRRAKWRQV